MPLTASPPSSHCASIGVAELVPSARHPVTPHSLRLLPGSQVTDLERSPRRADVPAHDGGAGGGPRQQRRGGRGSGPCRKQCGFWGTRGASGALGDSVPSRQVGVGGPPGPSAARLLLPWAWQCPAHRLLLGQCFAYIAAFLAHHPPAPAPAAPCCRCRVPTVLPAALLPPLLPCSLPPSTRPPCCCALPAACSSAAACCTASPPALSLP